MASLPDPDDVTTDAALEPKVLEGQGIRLRPWRDDDARRLQQPDPGTRHMVTDMQPAPSDYAWWLQSCRDRMSAGQAVFWCIADAATDDALGHIQVNRLDVDFTRGNGELGYWLYPGARGRGVMFRAVELVRSHAFAPREAGGLGLHRLQAGSDVANRASARVLRRAGFRMWGIEQSVLSHHGRPPSDALNWELLATDDVEAQRVSPSVIPTIELGHLRLRPWRDDDGSGFPETADELSMRYLPAAAQVTRATFPAWLARQRRFADEARTVPWCIADGATDEPLGNVSIFNIGEGTATQAEVGYWLLPAGRGRAALASALEVVVTHGFSATDSGGLGLTRLYAETDLDNIASQTALRRAGFRRWGEDRQAYTAADGRITDGAYFELLSTDDREAQRAVKPPVLDFPRVRLRPLHPDDAPSIAQTWSESAVRHWLSVPTDDLAARAASYIARKRHVDNAAHGSWWVICSPGSDDFCGVIGLQRFEAGNAEVGYWVAAEARGHGLASAAVDAVATYAFMAEAAGGLGLRRLRAGIADGNVASVKVAENAGFGQYGRAHAAELLGDGSVADLLLYERLTGSGR